MVKMDPNEIRLKAHLGIVTSDTSTVQFSFFVTPLKNRTWVGKEDYVMIDHPVFGELCPVLAMVKEIRNYEEVVGTSVRVGEKSVEMVAVGEIIGYVDLRDSKAKPMRKLFVPPNTGSRVYLPYFEFLEDVFLRGVDGRLFEHALHVGRLESLANDRKGDAKPLNFCLDAEDFSRQHFLVAGVSGAGKTHTASVIVEELANKTGCHMVVLDPYGEYTTVGAAGSRFKELVEDGGVSAEDYLFDFEVSIYCCDPERVSNDLKKRGIRLGRNARFSVNPVSGRWMETPGKEAEVEMKNVLKEGVDSSQVTVIGSRGLSPGETRNFFACCVRALWSGRVDGSVEPFVLVVEEAESLDAETLGRIASEGRKFEVSLCLLSQHPTDIDRRVLSQMGTQFMGRTTDAGDLEYLRNMAGEKSSLLPQLRTGEWIVNGITLKRPTKVFVRDRYSLDV